jgi:hypothetical protein
VSNALFDISREKFLSSAMSWSSDDIRCCLVRGYTYSSAHTTLASVTGAGGTVVASSGAFTSKTVTNGVADAADVTFTAVGAGAAITSIIVYREGASDSLRDLVAYLDTGTGLPVTPDGTDITIAWDGGANKIFKL